VRADHVEAAVREVDDAHDPEDQRQSRRHEKQQQPVLQAVEALNQERRERHILQPRPGSARPFVATPITMFSLPTTWRRDMSCTGLWLLPKVNVPRGLSILAFSSAAANSGFLLMSPFTALRPIASICAASYPCTA